MPPPSKQKIWYQFLYLAAQVVILGLISYWLVGMLFDHPKAYEANPANFSSSTLAVANTVTSASFPLGNKIATSTKTASSTQSKKTHLPFVGLKLQAKSALVYDLDTQKTLYELSADDRRPIASITKLMTAYAASLLLSSDSTVLIDQTDANVVSSAGLTAGESWKFSDLLAFTLVSSSNGGATAIARAAAETAGVDFITQMNNVAKELSLSNTLFRNETGLDLNNGLLSGSYSTARDIAKLLGYIEQHSPQLLTDTNKTKVTLYSLEGTVHTAINTNLLVAKIPNLLASKTGTTDLAGGNLAIVFEPTSGHKVVVVVLGSTPQGRFDDISTLVSDTSAYFKNPS